MPEDARRRTPRTDAVLGDDRLAAATQSLGRSLVKATVASVLEECRAGRVAPTAVVDAVLDALPPTASSLRTVVNATGIVVHTNLGRAPLSDAAVEAVRVAAGATDVELDLRTGRRGRRGAGALAALAAAVPDAAAVHVVNNGAAALALVTGALAQGREVVVARGELVEIGDGFRIPELLESLGARLREVGTTNRVRVEDYRAAIGPDTAFLLKVHPSNFVVEGFASSVGVDALAALGRDTGVPVVADIGSGLLAPHPRLPAEPDAATSLRAGADLVTASADKLLGGPQAGLLLGRADLVERLRRHPVARALRVDKLTLAALEATLAGPTAPVPAALCCDVETLRARAEELARSLADLADLRDMGDLGDLGDLRDVVQVVASRAAVGGGGAPGVYLPSVALSLPADLAAPLRLGPLPVVGHVEGGRLLLDLLTVPAALDDRLADAVRRAIAAVATAERRVR